MELFYGGGEISSFRAILAGFDSPPISLSYVNMMRNEKAIPSYEGSMFLDSGSLSVSKSEAEFDVVYEQAAQYMNFVKANIDKVHMVSEFDAQQLTLPVIKQFRSEFYNSLPEDKFMPVWHPYYGNDELEDLCSSYPLVGVTQEDIHGDTSNVALFTAMIARYGVRLHGVGITSKRMLEAVKWTSVSSTAWLSTTRYGELFVWTGREFKRYPKAYKDRAAKTHRTLFNDNGFSYQKIEEGDSDELLRLSVWSWGKYIESLTPVTSHSKVINTSKKEYASTEVDNQENNTVQQTPLTIRETTAIPILFQTVITEDDDDGGSRHSPVVNIRSESMRICDTCFLKDKCPGFEPNATCLYNIPIEIKTRNQLKSLQNALVEMQTGRVLFMKMAEDLEGGFSSPVLSSEIDRLERMIKTTQESEQDKFSMSVTMSQGNKGPSFVEKMLGASVSKSVQALDAPIDADDLIMNSELAELVED